MATHCAYRKTCLEQLTDTSMIHAAPSSLSSRFSSILSVRGSRPGKPVHLEEYEIKYLCLKARDIFINQPILLELEAPIKICGEYPIVS